MKAQTDRGFSLIELLIVVAIIGIIASIALPAFMDAIDRSKQRRSMADMHSLSTANATYKLDLQVYTPTLLDLQFQQYLQVVVLSDAWGNPFGYNTNSQIYDLTSFGSDGAAGPAAPSPWINDPFDPDIVLANGMFTQSPGG